ncbi:MAG: PotD/PotF family extracellular solute-binding protein [Candidatus Babeliales bacterium]
MMELRVLTMRITMVGVWLVAFAAWLYAPLLFQRWQRTQSLNILIWPTMLDAKKLAEFEHNTGIKLYISYYESNDELVRKLRVTKGAQYDLVIAADTAVHALIQEKLVQPIDTNKLSFYSDVRPWLLHHYFDPNNRYSVPYYMSMYGLGIDRRYFKELPSASWALLFENNGYRITMTDDPRRALLIAANYLFGSFDDLDNPERIADIKHLLLQQKKWVELYSDIRGEEVLAAQSCPVALTISSDLTRVQREYPTLQFLIPQEGTFMTIDSCIIPVATSKQELVYQLLNVIYQPDMIRYHADKYGFCPPLKSVAPAEHIICPDEQQLKQIDFFRNVVPKDVIDKLWVAVMAH